jgi:transposase-like protein
MLKLEKEDYDIVYELYFKNTSIHQLSKKLGISRPAVRWRRGKALKRLKKIILENGLKIFNARI